MMMSDNNNYETPPVEQFVDEDEPVVFMDISSVSEIPLDQFDQDDDDDRGSKGSDSDSGNSILGGANDCGFEIKRKLWRQQWKIASLEADLETVQEETADQLRRSISPTQQIIANGETNNNTLGSILPNQGEYQTQEEWLAAAFQATYEAGKRESEKRVAKQITDALVTHNRTYEAEFATLEVATEQRISATLEAKMIEMAPLVKSMQLQLKESAHVDPPPRRSTYMGRRSLVLTKKLTEDTFNFLLIAPLWSVPFFLGITVFILQAAIFTLAAVNMIDIGDPENPFMIPSNVTAVVRVIQFVAILISVTLQDDLVTCLDLLKDGYTKHFQDSFEFVTPIKFTLVSLLRFMVGCLSLLVMFLLIVSSTTVIDILLNFTAVHFISGLDELFFYLASHGLLGPACAEEAQIICQTTYVRAGAGYAHWQLKTLQLGTVLVILWCGLGAVVHQQNHAVFVCNTVNAQFGDDLIPGLGAFSGLYDKTTHNHKGFGSTRVEYLERRTQRAKFAYCSNLGVWTFTWIDQSNVTIKELDPCNWKARSSPTGTFDLTETTHQTWYIQDHLQRVVVLDPFYLECADCDENQGDCTGRGTCKNAVCNCDNGWFGLQCEFESPCEALATDARFGSFPVLRRSSSQLKLLQDQHGPVTVYYRPVYLGHLEDASELIFFAGRRWVVTTTVQMPEIPANKNTTSNVLGQYFRNEFHGYWSEYSVDFISEPRDIGTQEDASTPIGAQWFFAVPSSPKSHGQSARPSSADTVLVCSTCSNLTNPCSYNGVCSNNGTCLCSSGSEGSLCEKAPIGNGHCDPYFNTPEFGLDGGDCCESTCVSSSQYTCGDISGNDYVRKAYFFCKLQKEEWYDQSLTGAAASFSGFALDVSQRAVAVSELLQDRVQIYHKIDKSWLLRDTIVGAPDSRFGTRVGLSSGPYNVVSNPSFLPPLTVAVLDAEQVLRIYKCNRENCSHSREIPQVFMFDLSEDGAVLVTTMFAEESWPPSLIRVYEMVDGMFQVRADINVKEIYAIYAVFSMAQSGDGRNLILQKQRLEVDAAQGGFVSREEIFEFYGWNGTSYEVEARLPYKAGFNAYGYEFSLAMSADGSVVAFGTQGCLDRELQVFDLHVHNNTWVARTPAPPIHNMDCIDSQRPIRNNNLALSKDGSILAYRLGNGVQVFQWKSQEWHPIGNAFPPTNYPVSLSSDGTQLAIGSPEDGVGGITTMYSLPQSNQCRQNNNNQKSTLHLSLTLDSFPADLSWEIKNTGDLVYQQGPYPMEYALATLVEKICVDTNGSCYEFTIHNKQNGGLQPPGQYVLYLDDKKVGEGTFDGLFVTINFGNCPSSRSLP